MQQIIWLTWGLTVTDLEHIPAAPRYSFTNYTFQLSLINRKQIPTY